MIEDLLLLHKKALLKQGQREYDVKYPGKNISCGDELTYFIKFEKNLIKDVSFLSKGCAVSTTWAYLLSEKAKEMSKDKLVNMSDEEYFSLIGLPISPGRIKCALLPLITLKRALNLWK